MKHFAYTKENGNWQNSGDRNVTVSVYRIKFNIPTYIGEFVYHTSANRGDTSEVVRFLVDQKQLPKTCLDGRGYVNYDRLGRDFEIHSL